MTEDIDFTLGDGGDPMLFMVLSTRHWVAGTHGHLDSLLLLLSALHCRRRRAHARRRRLRDATHAIENVRRQLREATDDLDRGLRRTLRLSIGYYGSRPVPPALVREEDTAMSILKRTRGRMDAVEVELSLFFAQLLVLSRTRRKVNRRRLARAKRVVRAAREELADAKAYVEQVFSSQPDLAGEAVALEAS